MMSRMTTENLIAILDHAGAVCVSIFLPTHPDQFERQQEDALQLKNLLRDAEERAATFDPALRTPDIAALLEPAALLLRQSDGFWRQAGAGVAIYLTPGWHAIARLPLRFEPQIVVGSHFYIKPLVPLLDENGRFFILTLCQNDVGFYEATHGSIRSVLLPEIPTSLDMALALDDMEKQSQFHTGTAPASVAGRREAVFFGHGTIESTRKDELLRYCQQIDAGLWALLHDETAPLLVACVDYLFPIYREANSYAHLLDQNLAGNPELLSASELHSEAWQLVKPVFNEARTTALDRYGGAHARQRATADVEQVVVAAHHGRVDTLFTAVDRCVWGRYDPTRVQVDVRPAPRASDEDLLDTAVRYTLRAGGIIYALPAEQMPENSALAAILRY